MFGHPMLSNIVGAKSFINQICVVIGSLKLVLRPNFCLGMAHVKLSCGKFVKAWVDEL